MNLTSLNLAKVKIDSDVVELFAVCDGRTLPPALAPVNGVVDWMTAIWIGDVTHTALYVLTSCSLHMLSQTTEPFGSVLAAGGIRCDAGASRKVESRRGCCKRRQ